jgi:hypothetical protein
MKGEADAEHSWDFAPMGEVIFVPTQKINATHDAKPPGVLLYRRGSKIIAVSLP